jgi:RNA polymerase sigma-B factor
MPAPSSLSPRTPCDRRELGDGPPEALFRRYRDHGDAAAREQLVLSFLPLARRLARRYARSSVPYEDVVQVASLALVKAIDRFDVTRGRAFQAYAIPTILGEIKRYFRDSAWALHVTRGAQERALAIERAKGDLSERLGRTPTVQELAVGLELSQEEVVDGLVAAESYTTVSLDAALDSSDSAGEVRVEHKLGAEDPCYELVEDKIAVADAVRELPEGDRRILRLRFYEELTQAEIGRRLGVSQMQVSRLLGRSLRRLRHLAGAAPERQSRPATTARRAAISPPGSGRDSGSPCAGGPAPGPKGATARSINRATARNGNAQGKYDHVQ